MAFVQFTVENLRKIADRLESLGLNSCDIETNHKSGIQGGWRWADIYIQGSWNSSINEQLKLEDNKLFKITTEKEVKEKL